MHPDDELRDVFWSLRLGLGSTAFLAGLDKYFDLLARWDKYLAPQAKRAIPLRKRNFMRLVGIVEMLVGAGILSRRTRLASYAASAWLTAIAANLIMNRDYDIAVRDLNMAVGAYALARMSGQRELGAQEEEIVEHALQEKAA
jgi:uncharacterized membrane protein YphA (DoxX/SURF4 family)